MNAQAMRLELVDETETPRPFPQLVPRRTPSTTEIDAFVRDSERRVRKTRKTEETAPRAGVATVGAVMSFVEETLCSEATNADEKNMERSILVGDYDGALVLASVLVYRDSNNWRARRVKTWCAQMSKAKESSAQATPSAVLSMAVQWDILADYPLTREQAFVLSLVDGVSTVSDVIDASALARPLAQMTLDSLLAARLVVARM